MKTYGGVELYLHHSSPWSLIEVNGQFHALTALLTEKYFLYTLHRRLGGTQSRSGHFGKQKKIFPCQDSNSGSSSPSLYQLSYTDSSSRLKSTLENKKWSTQKPMFFPQRMLTFNELHCVVSQKMERFIITVQEPLILQVLGKKAQLIGHIIWYSWGSVIETSSIFWDQLIGFYLKTETGASLRNGVLNQSRTMDNVQNCDSYTQHGAVVGCVNDGSKS
jgi:hypothetical protein